jgi:hypothetical protein
LDENDAGEYCCSVDGQTAPACITLDVHHIHLEVEVDFCESEDTFKPCCTVKTSDPYVRNNSIFLLSINSSRSRVDFDETKMWNENNTEIPFVKSQSFQQVLHWGDNVTCELQDPRHKTWRLFRPIPLTQLNCTDNATIVEVILSDIPAMRAEDTSSPAHGSQDTTGVAITSDWRSNKPELSQTHTTGIYTINIPSKSKEYDGDIVKTLVWGFLGSFLAVGVLCVLVAILLRIRKSSCSNYSLEDETGE